MVKLTVLYPRQEGGTFDMNYYLDTHLPLARKLLAPVLKGLTVDEGVTAGDLPAPYAVVCHLAFDSLDQMQAALSAAQAALAADIPNYTNVEPVFQVSAVTVA